jgi:hypothetical protein
MTIRRILAAVSVAAVIATGSATAADAPTQPHPWVLLGVDINMGAVTVRDTAKDADTVSVYREGLPVFRTKEECQFAMRRAIQKFAGRSHAEGNFGNFLCADVRTWTKGE